MSALLSRAEMYAGRVAFCRLVSYGKYADGADRRTDAVPLHYVFRYGRGSVKIPANA